MVMAWAFRLGSYLFIRILKDGKDKRFDKVRDNPARFFTFWTIQGNVYLGFVKSPMYVISRGCDNVGKNCTR